MKPLKERISITIDGDVLQSLREYSEQYDRSVSQLINIILKDYFDSKISSPSAQERLKGK
ncbi:MAG: toxin-antitoxin system protein [Clostridia bacterium]|nr:toxin-antitoxin system protein [Clostridia bacterium]